MPKTLNTILGCLAISLFIVTLPCNANEKFLNERLLDEHGSVMIFINPDTGLIEWYRF